MIIHYSILGVILFVSLFWNKFALQKKQIDPNAKLSLTPWLLTFGYIAFLAAMRTKYNDTSVYVSSFENAVGGWEQAIYMLKNSDIKYAFTSFLENLFKGYISEDYHAWFAFFAIIESLIFVYVYRRECNDIFVPVYYFFTSSLYTNYFSMMRQWMAVSIIFVALIPFKEKKWIKFALCCIFAYLIHPSAIFGVVFYFLALGQPWKFKQTSILVVAAIALLFMNPLLNSLETSMDGFTYDYAIETMNTNSGSSPIRALIAFVPVVLSFICRKDIDAENSKTLNIAVNMTVFFFLLNLAASITSGLYVVRLATYVEPFVCILYSYLLTRGLKPQYRRFVLVAFIVLYFAYYVYAMDHSGAGYYISDILGTFK
ncbi:EpsG family protein [uncultured Eubacterium sp.]|uniref:EpsG family protein n=1 Tax=uncultured Eubacterium sp. TaxID=165185 RepID=UPI0025FDD23E|nr:EpsG family protein [uncultured Eubacterium sp.]